MTPWILMLITISGEGMTATSTEFNGKFACEHAQELMVDKLNPVMTRYGSIRVISECVPKDDPERFGPYLPYVCTPGFAWINCQHELPKQK